MENKLIKEKLIKKNGIVFTFQVWTLTGRCVYWGKDALTLHFDIDNDEQLNFIAELLCDILKQGKIVDKYVKIVDDDMEEKLNDFDTLVEILNKYKGE